MTEAELIVYSREKKIPGTIILSRGWPDFLVLRNGKAHAIEVKRPADRVSEEQAKMHNALETIGLKVTTEVVRRKIDGDIREALRTRDARNTCEILWERMFTLEAEIEKTRRLLQCAMRAKSSNH